MRFNHCNSMRLKEAKFIAISNERHGLVSMFMATMILRRCNCKNLAKIVENKIDARIQEKMT